MKIIISKKMKKLISRITKRCARIIICDMLLMTQILPVYASISASDGTGVVTKIEFNSVMADFNSRLSKFETGMNTKIEAIVNEYLSNIEIVGGGAKGYVINNETEITGTKDATTGAYSNVTAITGIEIADLKIGDNIYVRDDTASNYYVSQISPTVSLNVLNKSINNVVDNLTSSDIDKPLSAKMGKKLNDEKQKDIMTYITGNANQVLARNSGNNGLEFKTINLDSKMDFNIRTTDPTITNIVHRYWSGAPKLSSSDTVKDIPYSLHSADQFDCYEFEMRTIAEEDANNQTGFVITKVHIMQKYSAVTYVAMVQEWHPGAGTGYYMRCSNRVEYADTDKTTRDTKAGQIKTYWSNFTWGSWKNICA